MTRRQERNLQKGSCFTWYDQPMFQDGTIANAVADAVGEGVVYVSAAGNDAQTHYQGDYEATSGQNSFHLFHTGDNILLVDVPTNLSLIHI